jgi:hypothetical protein
VVEEISGGPLPGRIVLAVVQCRQPEELVGALLRSVQRPTDRLSMR